VEAYEPDVIYLRYGIYVFPAHRLASIAPVVEEVNTNDLTQHEGLGRAHATYNRWTRGLLLRRVRGLVTVSRELASISAFSRYRKPTSVIANGIDLHAIEALPPPRNERPRLAFIGNPGFAWHGIDKLVALARSCPDLDLDIIGYDSLPEFEPLPANLSLHGFLEAERYRGVLSTADVSVSSLALHRIGLEEASPLKSRECLALGLPLIFAYEDTDLGQLDCDFLLRIPNREENIATHSARIRAFAYDMRGRRVDRRLIETIDQGGKEAVRLRFLGQMASVRAG
jgi:glycosyltransferase involved in cell wall biosynthesis